MAGAGERPRLRPTSRIGIVNRGEPAVRFIRAVREYNEANDVWMQTVAFYLDEEADAVFVREADEAVALRSVPGSVQAGSAYLNKEALTSALVSAGCDAVWPGWGFVSEDAAFARMVEDSGIVFLGPDSEAMALLGDKIAAKDLAARSGVPILPWSRREIGDLADAQQIAESIGYPVIVKAAHAGGGRGIRFVFQPGELQAQLLSAREETRRVTGDEIVFIERLVRTGRHLEVQCLCDRHGNVHTFGVRDCSVQRRNQKIVEETPPPGMAASRIAEIEAAAARLMGAAGYESAGTVEFLYDLDRDEFYFMEVNTRLQVEHPITEVLYGIDLVQGQIDVAYGKPVEFPELSPRGAVIEVRLNAEDPDRDFTPSPGRVGLFRLPAGPGVRVDSGISQGSRIPSIFDSMVAKIIACGRDRTEALARLRRALAETRIAIEGGTTNKAFLLTLLRQPELIAGGVHTRWVEEFLSRGSAPTGSATTVVALVAAAIDAYLRNEYEDLDRFQRQIITYGYPRNTPSATGFEVVFGLAGNSYTFFVRRVSTTRFHLDVDGLSIRAEYETSEDEGRLRLGRRRWAIQIMERGDALQVEVDGAPTVLQTESGGAVKAPSPAVVLAVAVGVGQAVEKGQRLLSLEAMKMEMVIEAPVSGVVRSVAVGAGQQVAAGDVLLELDAPEEGDSGSTALSAPRVEFAAGDGDASPWEELSQALTGHFTGFDSPVDPASALDELVALARADGTIRSQLVGLLHALFETLVCVDTLFSSERLVAEQFARAISWQELLYVCYRYGMHDSDALPARFREALDRAVALYPAAVGARPPGPCGSAQTGPDRGAVRLWAAFRYMQRTQREPETRQSVVRAMLFALEELPVPISRVEELIRLLDEVIRLYQLRSPSLADAALHARYHLHEQNELAEARRRRSARVRAQVGRLTALAVSDPERPRLEERVIDSSPYIVYELAEMLDHGDDTSADLIVSLLARRSVRDRAQTECRRISAPCEGGVLPAGLVVAGGIRSILAVATRVEQVDLKAVSLLVEQAVTDGAGGPPPEVEILVVAGGLDAEEVYSRFSSTELPVSWIAVGVYETAHRFSYRTWRRGPDRWGEDVRKREFSPLFYRELRVYRLANFEPRVVYHSESVYLIAASATGNPRDERLFALGTASESEPEFDALGQIERVTEFDEVFMEAALKMRSEQAHRTRRLFWNRIIVHIRALIPLTAAQIKEYGGRIVPRTRELGLEKVVIYTRRKRWSEDVVRELELLFLNISEDQFTLRSRTPSDEPYKPMDRYVSNVVRSRQRKNVYPYELVKMITFTGYPVSANVPRGDFEEFDLDPAETSRAVSVKGRDYGRNDSNIVFGIVRNPDPQTGHTFRRVLILSDATADMGSLAEPECRRVIAAIGLAQERSLVVEWVPISSGARIDMKSGTENLDWTAAVLRRIVEFTQAGGEINVIVGGINVGAQSYWNAEATMLMHTRGLLIMTDEASMLLTGKKALDFSGSVSGDTNIDIGGVERIMGPNGQAQISVPTLAEAYALLFEHYRYTYVEPGQAAPAVVATVDRADRDMGTTAYDDRLGQGFGTIADIFSAEHNAERKKPFDMRQVMRAFVDRDAGYLERWAQMRDAETAITWETRAGGRGIGLIGIESRALARLADVPHDGPESWTGGTLFPLSSKKVARAINSWSGRLPVVVLANLSGFDGSPESLRKLQLEYGAEIGRAVVNFRGPLVFVVVARYHGGAYVVFSKSLNPSLTAFALEGSFASVLGGAPAAAVVYPRQVEQEAHADRRYAEALTRLETDPGFTQRDFDEAYRQIHTEKQSQLAARFDAVHSVRRALEVGSIDRILTVAELRAAVIETIERQVGSS